MTQNQIEIPLSKSKIYMILLGAIIFVTIGIWILIKQPSSNHIIFGNTIIMNIAGILSILFFGFIAFFVAKKISDKKPGLIINAEGIYDNSSGVSAGLILWSDMNGVSVKNVANQKFIMIELKNPQLILSKFNSNVS